MKKEMNNVSVTVHLKNEKIPVRGKTVEITENSVIVKRTVTGEEWDGAPSVKIHTTIIPIDNVLKIEEVS